MVHLSRYATIKISCLSINTRRKWGGNKPNSDAWAQEKAVYLQSPQWGQSINQSMKLDIAPLQDIYSEALPAQPRLKRIVFREDRTTIENRPIYVVDDFCYIAICPSSYTVKI